MKHVLLLGAGFSRNWGGWLANEVYEYLIGCSQVQRDPELRKIVTNNKFDFEAALGQLQANYRNAGSPEAKQRLLALQAAICEMFEQMDAAFTTRVEFEFQTHIQFMVRTMLARFDSIFTLNQDTLLDRHYLNDNIALSGNRRWTGWQLPGIRPIRDSAVNAFRQKITNYAPLSEPEFAVASNLQPLFKLHGAINIRSADGDQLLIMGNNKTGQLQTDPLLRWYFDEFERLLTEPIRLMVIGYSFGDQHINDVMIRSAQRRNLQLFIIDPHGTDAPALHNKTRGAPIYDKSQIEKELEPTFIGASRRPLTQIFGIDHAEHAKVSRFFAA
jgi:hypothetical protein